MLGPYRELLRRPHVGRLVVSALVGRIPIGIASLALILLIRDTTGSYATAGVVSAAYGLAAGAGGPVLGRVIDVIGHTRVLVGCGVGQAGLLAGLVVLALGGAPTAALVASAAAAGALIPPLSASMRALWPELVGEDGPRDAAYALEAVTVELFFIAGPVIAAVVSALASPAAAVLVAAALTVAGTLGFAGSPASRDWRPHAAREASRAGALASAGLRTLALGAFPVGIAFGSLEVSLPAFAEGEAAAETGGLLLAGIAAGSLAGGLWYGAREFSRPLARRYLELNALLALGFTPLVLAGSLGTMTVVCVLGGLALAPMTAATYALVERVAPVGTTTEANTWVITAQATGAALGAAAGGVVVEAAGLVAALAPGAVAAGTLVVVARRASLGGRATATVRRHA